jgi:hypothetical protein
LEKLLKRPRIRRIDDVYKKLREIGYKGEEWAEPARNLFQLQALLFISVVSDDVVSSAECWG